MIPTRAQVLTQARAHLNDVQAEVFTDTLLGPFFETAYRKVCDEMTNLGLPRFRRTAYYNLPAYTAVLAPVTAGISDFGELVEGGMCERRIVTTANITAATNATPIVATAAGHGRSTGDRVQIYGIVGQTGGNGEWLVTVSGDNLTLNGSITEGAYTSGGVVTYSDEDWSEMDEVELGLEANRPLNDRLHYFEWQGDVFRFVGATEARQLKITYFASGAAPASGSLGIDNSLDFLAAYTACLAAYPNDRVSEGDRLFALCFGVPRQSTGLLHDLLNPMVKAQQRVQRQPQAYSPYSGGRIKRRAPYIVV